MRYFGFPVCPYCKKRVNLIRTWSLKKQGEYRCPRCGGISNIFLSPLIYVFALLALFSAGAAYFFHRFILEDLTVSTLFEVFIPFAAFFFLSLFMVYLAKPVIKKKPVKAGSRRKRAREEDLMPDFDEPDFPEDVFPAVEPVPALSPATVREAAPVRKTAPEADVKIFTSSAASERSPINERATGGVTERRRAFLPNATDSERRTSTERATSGAVDNRRPASPGATESRRTVLPNAAESERRNSTERATGGTVDNRGAVSPNTAESRRAVSSSTAENRRTVLPTSAESGRRTSTERATSGTAENRRTVSPGTVENRDIGTRNAVENRRAVSPNTTENQRAVTPSITEGRRAATPSTAEHVRVAPDAGARDVPERRRSSVESALRAEAAEAIGEPILRRGENRARAVEVPDIAMPARPRRTAAPEALERPLSPSEGRRTRSAERAPSRGAEDGYTPLDAGTTAAASDAPVPRRVDIGTGDDFLARYDDPDYVARRLQERNAPKGPET